MFRRVVITKPAQKDLAKLEPRTKEMIIHSLSKLESIPSLSMADLKKLQGVNDLWRLRVGDWRILLRFNDNRIIIYALRVNHRREAY